MLLEVTRMVVVAVANVTRVQACGWIEASGNHFTQNGVLLLTQLLVVMRFHVLLEVAHIVVLGVANRANMLAILTLKLKN